MRKGKLSKELLRLIAIVVSEIIVFSLVFGIVVRFLPDYADIHSAIVILFVFTIGITLIIYGNTTRKRYLNVLGFLIFLFAVYIVIEIYEGFAVKISAFATLGVAIAAFVAIEENRRIRQDSVEREGRDRKERLIDEVAGWLRGIEDHIFPERGRIMSQISQIEDRLKGSKGIGFEQWVDIGEIDIDIVGLNKLDRAMKEAEYYQKLTLQFDEELSRLIGVIIDEIKEREVLLSADITYRRGRIKEDKGGKSAGELPKDDNRKSKRSVSSEEDIISGKLKGNADAIKESIQKAIEKAIEAKVSLIQGS